MLQTQPRPYNELQKTRAKLQAFSPAGKTHITIVEKRFSQLLTYHQIKF